MNADTSDDDQETHEPESAASGGRHQVRDDAPKNSNNSRVMLIAVVALALIVAAAFVVWPTGDSDQAADRDDSAITAIVSSGDAESEFAGRGSGETAEFSSSLESSPSASESAQSSLTESAAVSTPSEIASTSAEATDPNTLPRERPVLTETAPPDTSQVSELVEVVLSDSIGIVNGSASMEDLSDIAAGVVLGELEASAAEFENNGWRQEGSPTITSILVLDQQLDVAPPKMTVQVCLDSTSVQIYDDQDQPLRDSQGSARTLNIYTLEYIDGTWLLSDHTYPDEPDC